MSNIKNSVGRRGVNKDQDTKIVQTLLNRHIIPHSRIIKVDGLVGPNTITAILAFQHRLGLAKPDGLVSPAGRTFSALCTLPYSVPLTEKVLDHFSTFSNMLGKMSSSLISNIESNFKSVSNPSTMQHLPPSPPSTIAWGAKVSPEFKKRVIEICKELVIVPDYLMSCMAFETGGSFRADIPNKEKSGAIGLIQFMPSTAIDLGSTTEKLAKLTSIEQLEYVRKYFFHRKGKLHTLEDVYLAILFPAGIGKDVDTPIMVKGDKYYKKNAGLDTNHDNTVTPRECSVKLQAMYKQGLSKGYFG